MSKPARYPNYNILFRDKLKYFAYGFLTGFFAIVYLLLYGFRLPGY